MNVSKRLDSLQEAVEFADEMDRILMSYQGFQEVEKPPNDSVDSESEFDYSACHIPDGYTMISERRKAKQESSDTDNDIGGGCSLM